MPPPVTHSCTRIIGDRGEVITPVSFRVIPVIDLKGGRPVHAIGGRRAQYRPLKSVWQATSCPIGLTLSVREGLGIDRLYLADLDAIEGGHPDLPLYDRLAREGFRLWIDAGVRDESCLGPLMDLGHESLRILVGLESVRGPSELARIVDRSGPDRLIFSLDLYEGRARIARGSDWPCQDPLDIASEVIEQGIRRLILLDIARVGTGRGAGTQELLNRIRLRHPETVITLGGGIQDIEDILELRVGGASGVLVGTALHSGRIGREQLEQLSAASGGAR